VPFCGSAYCHQALCLRPESNYSNQHTTKFAGSNSEEAVGFLGRKIPQRAFLRRGSKAVGPMS
jgi:hypothetical protein